MIFAMACWMSGFTPGNQLPKALQEVTGNGYQEKMQWKYRKIFQLKILVQGFTPTFLVQKVETFPPTRSPHSKRSFGERASVQYLLGENYSRHFLFLQQRTAGEREKFVPRGVDVGKRKRERGGRGDGSSRLSPSPTLTVLLTLNQSWPVEQNIVGS